MPHLSGPPLIGRKPKSDYGLRDPVPTSVLLLLQCRKICAILIKYYLRRICGATVEKMESVHGPKSKTSVHAVYYNL